MRTEKPASYEDVVAHLHAGGTVESTSWKLFGAPVTRYMVQPGLLQTSEGHTVGFECLSKAAGFYRLKTKPEPEPEPEDYDRLLRRVKELEARLARITAIAGGAK